MWVRVEVPKCCHDTLMVLVRWAHRNEVNIGRVTPTKFTMVLYTAHCYSWDVP